MKIGTKIIATNSDYKTNVPNGEIMTVTHVFESGQVNATIDGGDGFKWYLFKEDFEEYTPAKETGTLKEMNVQAGDVVSFGRDVIYTMKIYKGDLWAFNDTLGHMAFPVDQSREKYTIISRATPDQVTPVTPDLPYGHATMPDGRVVDLTANRVRVDLMDRDELEAMKDHGGPWEICGYGGKWKVIEEPGWLDHGTYRVEPVVRTEVMYTNINTDSPWGLSADSCPDHRTHKITLTIKDGDIIDTKTEKL